MVAASALVELSWQVPDAGDKARYLAVAETLLLNAQQHFLFAPADNDAVLANGTVTYPLAGISIIYGDYYLLEASLKYDATPPEWRAAAARVLATAGAIEAWW